MTQPKAKMNIPMCAACILLCLTLFSIHLTSGLYAKYTAKGNGSDEARVAKFDVDIKGSGADAIDVNCTTTSDSCTIAVTNNSEVAVKYEMIVSDLTGITATFNEGKNSGILAANGDTETHTLTFSVSNWESIGALLKTDPEETAVVSLPFTVTIDVVQID